MNKEKELVQKEYESQLAILEPEFGLSNVQAFKDKAKEAFDKVIPQMHVVFGNAKLPESTAIISCGTWFNCAGRKEGFCELSEICYDKCREVMSADVTRFRLEEEIAFRGLSAEKIAQQIIPQIKARNASKSKEGIKQVRWNEVGELRNQKDLEKVNAISNILYEEFGIHSYIYTHNRYLDFSIDRPHLTVLGSGFMVDNEYRVVKDKSTLDEVFFECNCDCTQCNICPLKLDLVIVEEERR